MRQLEAQIAEHKKRQDEMERESRAREEKWKKEQEERERERMQKLEDMRRRDEEERRRADEAQRVEREKREQKWEEERRAADRKSNEEREKMTEKFMEAMKEQNMQKKEEIKLAKQDAEEQRGRDEEARKQMLQNMRDEYERQRKEDETKRASEFQAVQKQFEEAIREKEEAFAKAQELEMRELVENQRKEKEEEERKAREREERIRRDTILRTKAKMLGIDTEGTYNVAIIGQSGTGKSTLINALIGKRVAKVAANECTMKIEKFDLEAFNLSLWDVPGGGTLRNPEDAKSYFDGNCLYFFDCLIIVMRNRISRHDWIYARIATGYNIRVVFVRSQSDTDVKNACRDIYDEKDIEELSANEKQELVSNLKQEFYLQFEKEIKAIKEDELGKSDKYYLSGVILREFLHKYNQDLQKAIRTSRYLYMDEDRFVSEVLTNIEKSRAKVIDDVELSDAILKQFENLSLVNEEQGCDGAAKY